MAVQADFCLIGRKPQRQVFSWRGSNTQLICFTGKFSFLSSFLYVYVELRIKEVESENQRIEKKIYEKNETKEKE